MKPRQLGVRALGYPRSFLIIQLYSILISQRHRVSRFPEVLAFRREICTIFSVKEKKEKARERLEKFYFVFGCVLSQ